MSKTIEIWKFIDNYEKNYQVSNFGNVKRLFGYITTKAGVVKPISENILNKTIKSNGYETVMLSLNGKGKRFHVHRLVAIYFIDNPLNKPEVNHKDGIKTNNNVLNLEWMTEMENKNHAVENGLMCFGENRPTVKLSEKKVIAIIRLFRINPKFNKLQLSKKLGVSDSTIHKIIKRKRWKHLTDGEKT